MMKALDKIEYTGKTAGQGHDIQAYVTLADATMSQIVIETNAMSIDHLEQSTSSNRYRSQHCP